MPGRTYVGKVLKLTLRDVIYVRDLAGYLDDRYIKYYVENRGVGKPYLYYIIGDDALVKSAIQYCYLHYNTKYRKVVEIKSIPWKKFVGTIDEGFCDHVMTGCCIAEFYQEVIERNQPDPIPVPCRHPYHASPVAVTDDTTVGGRYPPIVPYTVDIEDISDAENIYKNTICFCKCT